MKYKHPVERFAQKIGIDRTELITQLEKMIEKKELSLREHPTDGEIIENHTYVKAILDVINMIDK